MLKQGSKLITKSTSSVLSVSEISWIDKHIFEVTEASKNYFMVTQHICSKIIDMGRIDTEQTIMEEMVLLANSFIGIKLRLTN